MNRTLYNAAMEKVTMSEQCESRIFEAAVNMTPAVKKRKGKIRFIPVLAAVLIIGTTTAAAEGAFGWIKNMFSNDNFEITDEIVGMTGEMNNFICESQGGDIVVSPVGMIAEESTIYCLLHVDKMPDDIDFRNLKLQNVCVNDFNSANYWKSPPIDTDGNEVEGGSFGYGMKYKDDNLLAVEVFPSYKSFKNGDRLTLRFAKSPDSVIEDEIEADEELYFARDTIFNDAPVDCYADVSFNIGIGEVNYIDKTYEEYTAIELDSQELFIENLHVSPLRLIIHATKQGYSESLMNHKDIRITLNDGSVVTVSDFGIHASYNGGAMITDSSSGSEPLNDESTVTISGFASESLNDNSRYIWELEWSFENPIDPENISTIYVNDVCLYDSSKQ